MRALSSVMLVSTALCTFAFTANVAADDLRGFYAGASLGRAELQLEDADSRYDFKGHDTGYQIAVGYRIINWVAVEANYTDYGRSHDDVLGVDLEGEFTSYSLSAMGLWPIRDFDLFARLGVAHWDGELSVPRTSFRSTGNSNDALFGIGAQYRLGNLALRLDAQNLLLGFDDDGDDEADGDDWLSLYVVGFTYKFH